MQDCVKEVRDLESSYEDINALIELTEEEEDREMIKEIQREIAKFEKEFEDGGINFDIFSKEESSGEYTYIMYFYYGKEKYIVCVAVNFIKDSLLFRVVEIQRICEATATPDNPGRCQPERAIEQ